MLTLSINAKKELTKELARRCLKTLKK